MKGETGRRWSAREERREETHTGSKTRPAKPQRQEGSDWGCYDVFLSRLLECFPDLFD